MTRHYIATSKKDRKPYSKELCAHLYMSKPSHPLITENERKFLNRQDRANLEVKAKLLFEHFDVPLDHPHGWEIIALALASSHVFQILTPIGRPQKISPETHALFYRYFLRHKAGRDITDSQICLSFTKPKGLRDLKQHFPELTTAPKLHRRLCDLVSKARTARKNRAKSVCRVRKIRSAGIDKMRWEKTPACHCLDDVSLFNLKYKPHPNGSPKKG